MYYCHAVAMSPLDFTANCSFRPKSRELSLPFQPSRSKWTSYQRKLSASSVRTSTHLWQGTRPYHHDGNMQLSHEHFPLFEQPATMLLFTNSRPSLLRTAAVHCSASCYFASSFRPSARSGCESSRAAERLPRIALCIRAPSSLCSHFYTPRNNMKAMSD